jgi:hypothetical protein
VPDAISWGDVRIAAVIDWAGEVPDAVALLPGTSRADWERRGLPDRLEYPCPLGGGGA